MADSAVKEEIFGRKIFFLNPDNNTRREIIPELQEAEYEIYVIESYREALSYFCKNPTSIVFISIDNQLTQKGWFNFIKTCQTEENVPDLIMGVMSGHLKENDRKFFIEKGCLKAGIIDTFENNNKIVEKIKETLDSFNAKGRRQFVRADLKNDNEAKLFWNTGNKMHVLKPQDISTVGMAAVGPAAFLQVLQKGSVMRGLSVLLNGKQHGLEATVFAAKPYGNEFCIIILLFLKTTPTVTKDNIRQYICNSLQEAMNSSVAYEKRDAVQYNNLSYWDEAVNGNLGATTSEEKTDGQESTVNPDDESSVVFAPDETSDAAGTKD